MRERPRIAFAERRGEPFSPSGWHSKEEEALAAARQRRTSFRDER